MTDAADDDGGTASAPEWYIKQQAMKIKDVKTGQFIKTPKPAKKPRK